MHLDDTIVAIATPPGRGGIGVVRLSGQESRSITEPLLRLRHGLEPGRASFGELVDPSNGSRIDEVVVTYFAKPHSYTTDDVVEISAHGSPVVLRHIVEMAVARGARMAEPGEFTMRAFLNGRLDLTQAEAVRDLIESQTLYQAQVAAQQLEGALSRRLQPLKERLVDLIATLEAGVDFAEDDVSVMPDDAILKRIYEVHAPLQELQGSFAFGKVVHDGMTLAIVGRPNVGKSSLINRLVESERAIVTATPGTTRDLVTETVAIGGIPVRLIDTAGIRAATDEAESIGIQKSYEALTDADLVLVVLDPTSQTGPLAEEQTLIEKTQGRNRLLVVNKIDLLPKENEFQLKTLTGTMAEPCISTSAVTGAGISELRGQILLRVAGSMPQQESGFLTNVRHQALVNESLQGLQAAVDAVIGKVPHEMLLLDLYHALRPLDSITGETTADDILNRIFSTFCIGK